MLTDDRLRTLSDLHLAEAHREHARFCGPTHIVERGGLLLSAGGSSFPAPPINAALALGSEPADAEEMLERAQEFFAPLGRRCGIVVRTHVDRELARLCEGRGLDRVSESPAMALIDPVAEPELAEGVSVRMVRGPREVADFVEVSAAAYQSLGLPAKETERLLSGPETWLGPCWHAEVVYEHAVPVAAAMLLQSHGIAGVYWVGTLPGARGRGHAAAVTRSVSNHGLRLGARAVVLQASAMGEPVYRRIGFRTFSSYPGYLSPPRGV